MIKRFLKNKLSEKRILIRLVAVALIFVGITISFYIFFPLLSWQFYFAPIFANQEINSPIPKSTIVNNASKPIIGSLINQAGQSLNGQDYTNAKTWFPNYRYENVKDYKIKTYKITIPAINIKDATVSTIDSNLEKHLINYGGTAIPPQKGNAVIFGHSTLPQLFDSKDYKTIFANMYKLVPGDTIEVMVEKEKYIYNIESIVIVDPNNTSVLEQSFDDSFITLVTCTPPGTVWKRLVVRARLSQT